jgi:ABC-type branched-subunit amino acid transport system ATPase component
VSQVGNGLGDPVWLSERRGAGPPTGAAAFRLALEDVTVRFGGITALNAVSLSVRPGEVCGLIGPNGAGKTTLFDVISGVLRPARGRVFLDGRDISTLSVPDRSRLGLRRTFQRVQTFGWLTVEDNVLAVLECRGGGGGFLADLVGWPSRTRRERARRVQVAETLERCGLSAYRAEQANALPIGLARMVELARATVEAPQVLILDEPASGLDGREATRLGERIQAVRAETGCAVVLVEHNAGFVMDQCDRVAVLHLGSLLAEGTPQDIQANPAVQAAYLGEESHPAGPANARANGRSAP